MIRAAWRLLSVEDQYVLARRFAGNSRNVDADPPAPAALRKACNELRDLLASAGIGWTEASIALRHPGIDLRLQQIVRQADDTTSVADDAATPQ